MSFLFDLVSVCSVLGIWPRYCEPRWLRVTRLQWRLPSWGAHLHGRRFVSFGDLHFFPGLSPSFLDKIVRYTLREKPDAIFFTGDFICYSSLEDGERLKKFLLRFHAPYGAYCIFGNHDYAQYVSQNERGHFAIHHSPNPLTALYRGAKTLLSSPCKTLSFAPQIQHLTPHTALLKMLQETPFTLLENTTMTLPIGLNVTGLGEYALGRCRPQTAFSGYQKELPGIVLTHNPDTFPLLFDYPGEWLLAGHTHGEQIHLPFCRKLSKKLTRLAHTEYTRGYAQHGNKHLYVTRGVGSPKPFRLFSPPEIVVIEAVAS